MTKLLPLAIFIVISSFLWIGLHRDPRMIPSPLVNKSAPVFRAPSLLKPQLILNDQILKGKLTVLNVFASWCLACEAEHSVLMEERRSLPQVQFIGLNYKDDRAKALAWLEHYGNPYHQVIDDFNGNIGIDFGVYGTPETFIIDKQGLIRYKFIGPISPNDWKKIILPVLQQWQ